MSSKPASLFSHWQSLALVSIAAVAFVALYALVGMPQLQSAATTRHVDAMTKQLAQSQDRQIQQLTVQLDGLARSTQLRELMEEGDEVALERLSQQWRLMFANTDKLSFFPMSELGAAGLSDTLRAKLRNNIEKNMLHAVEKSDVAIVDVFRVEGDYKLCAARLVATGSRKLGAILLCLHSEWLAAQVQEFNREASSGRAALISELEGDTPAVVAGQALNTPFVAEYPLNTLPGFAITYAQPDALELGPAALIVVACGALVLLVVAVVAMQRVSRRVTGAYTQEAEQLQRYVSESFENEVSPPALNFPSLASVANAHQLALANYQEKAQQSSQQRVAEPVAAVDQVAALSGSPADTGIQVDDVSEAEPLELPPPHIFRAYDIRGVVGDDLTTAYATSIGRAFGTVAARAGNNQVVVGRDGRLSSDDLAEAVIEGLISSGCDVIDIGLVPSPLLYFAAEHLEAGAGLMVTGSHNPPEYNGFKMLVGGEALVDEAISGLHDLIVDGVFSEGEGSRSSQDLSDAYIDQIVDDVVFAAPVKVVLDCGNGAASEVAPLLYASMGAEVVPLFADVDGNFPNHMPDPGVAENLAALVSEVADQGADLGLAFDGDADRVVAVTAEGQIIEADQLLMLFAKDVLTRNPGADVVFDQKCTRELPQLIASHGGRPVAWKSGHSRIKQKMREVGALLGGEYSGHFFFKERWFGFDDGLYSGARLIEMLTLEGLSLADAVASLPQSVSSPELTVSVDEAAKFDIVEALAASATFEGGEVSTLDGVRVDFDYGWGLVRASNTSAKLTMRFEADSEAELEQLKALFAGALKPLGVEI